MGRLQREMIMPSTEGGCCYTIPEEDIAEFNNFWSITKLNTASKIRLALARLKPKIASSPNYDALQSAYQSGHLMERALPKIMDHIYCHIDVVSLWHSSTSISWLPSMLSIMKHWFALHRLQTEFGITRLPLNWISSYLSQEILLCSHQKFVVTYHCNEHSSLTRVIPRAYLVDFTCRPIGRLINNFGIGYHKYTDESLLYTALLASPQKVFNHFKMCSPSINYWFNP